MFINFGSSKQFLVDSLQFSVNWLKSPMVKPAIKRHVGTATFCFGIGEFATVLDQAYRRDFENPFDKKFTWLQTANKLANLSQRFSLLLSAAVSPTGVRLIGTLVGKVASPATLIAVFGPNTIFAVNPSHPRHVVSFVAVALALPVIAQLSYNACVWMDRTINHRKGVELLPIDRAIFTLFNLVFSRPTLHICSLILSKGF